MASKSVRDAVDSALGSPWASIDGTILSVIALNTTGDPPADGSPVLIVDYPLANERQHDFGDPGNNLWKEDGVFRLIINEQRAAGIERALGWADELGALFRNQIVGSVQCFETSGPVIDDRNELGSYFQISIAVRYRFYVTG